MYFPYLRGKQNELLAIREDAIMLANRQDTIPVIEPVKKNKGDLKRAIKMLNKARAPYILIVNPQDGELAKEGLDIEADNDLTPNSNAHLAFIINYKTSLKDIENFLNKYSITK